MKKEIIKARLEIIWRIFFGNLVVLLLAISTAYLAWVEYKHPSLLGIFILMTSEFNLCMTIHVKLMNVFAQRRQREINIILGQANGEIRDIIEKMTNPEAKKETIN